MSAEVHFSLRTGAARGTSPLVAAVEEGSQSVTWDFRIKHQGIIHNNTDQPTL